MNYTMLLWGLFFLFNPEIAIFDVLPDTIGFLLIAQALKPLAPISPSIETAVGCFRKLAAVHAVKVLAIIPLVGTLSGGDPAISMLFTFGFALVSMTYLVPAFEHLYSALSYFAARDGKRLPWCEFSRIFTLLSFLLRYLLAFLPQSVYLYIDNNNIYDVVIYPLAHYLSGLTVISFSLSLILGLIWLLLTFHFFRKRKNDLAMNRTIREELASVVYTRKQVALQTVKPIFLLLRLLFLSMIAITLDGITVFPSFMIPLVLFLLYRTTKPIERVSRRFRALALVTTVMGIVSFVINLSFRYLYGEKATVGFILVRDKFILPFACELLFTVLLVIALLPLKSILTTIIREYTGTLWESAYISHNTAAAKEKRGQLFSSKLILVFSCLLAVTGLVSYGLLYRIPEMRLLHSGLSLAFVIYAFSFLSSLYQSVLEKLSEIKDAEEI